ncbi:MAG: FadR family transcriptional regulator [Pararhodobacter sp.]|nr:FadR family transcriptional regulator [Pararhodobacter sp.]
MNSSPILDAQSLAQALLGRIRAGDCVSGDRLLPERELAVRLGVSRARLRAALAGMERDGLVFRRQGQGTFVRPPPAAESNQFRQLSNRVTAREVMEARLLLEPALVTRATARATADDLTLLRRLAQNSQEATTAAAYEHADDVFHFKLAEIAGNLVLQMLFEGVSAVRRQGAWSEHRQQYWSVQKARLLAGQHLAICDLMAAGAAEQAAALMHRHLQTSADLFEVPL